MITSKNNYLLDGKMVEGNTKVPVILPIREWLKIQTLVVCYELRVETGKNTPVDHKHTLRSIRQSRKALVKAITKARKND